MQLFKIVPVFTEEESNRIDELSMKLQNEVAALGDGRKDVAVRKTNRIHLPKNNDTLWIYEKINAAVLEANKTYKFDFSNGVIEDLNVLEYKCNDHYTWHIDGGYEGLSMNGGIADSRYRKLSCVVFLSSPEDFNEGQLEFKVGNEPIAVGDVPKGHMVVFPSVLLHRVKKVMKGRRVTMVTWVRGKAWQ